MDERRSMILIRALRAIAGETSRDADRGLSPSRLARDALTELAVLDDEQSLYVNLAFALDNRVAPTSLSAHVLEMVAGECDLVRRMFETTHLAKFVVTRTVWPPIPENNFAFEVLGQNAQIGIEAYAFIGEPRELKPGDRIWKRPGSDAGS